MSKYKFELAGVVYEKCFIVSVAVYRTGNHGQREAVVQKQACHPWRVRNRFFLCCFYASCFKIPEAGHVSKTSRSGCFGMNYTGYNGLL
ncbi:MAG: hypothetical protein LBJ00_12770 [Planctomycetaceae bacterium]|nr:hypothetical protein [Planctomycetaceae bacterium]